MADITSPIDNFSVEETIDMGVGDTTLVNDLLAPETSTADVDDIEKIEKKPEEKDVADDKKKSIDDDKKTIEDDNVQDDEKKEKQNLIGDFLTDVAEEDETKDNVDDIKKDEDDVKGEGDDNTDDVKKPEDETSSRFEALSNDLFKLGVFTKNEGEEDDDISITNPEEFLERFENEKKKGAMSIVDNFIGQFGEDYQSAFDAIYVKGVDPKEYFGIYNNVVDFAGLDLTVEANQKRVLRQALTDQGFESEDIDTEIERLTNYGDLEVVAGKHHKVLVKKDALKLKQKESEAEAALQQKTAIKSQYVQNVQSILQEKVKAKEFDGIPINGKTANELQDFLLVDKWKTAGGETLTDFDRTILELKKPENHATKVKVAMLLKMLEKDPTLSTIQRTAISKKSGQLFSEVARQTTKTKTEKRDSNKKKIGTWLNL